MYQNPRSKTWSLPTGIILVAALGLAACGQSTPAAKPESPAKLDSSGRVILTARAAERLGIQTVPLREERVVPRKRVGGDVVAGPAGLLVRVPVLATTFAQVDGAQSALIVPRTDLAASFTPAANPATGGTAAASVVTAKQVQPPPGASARDSTPTLYYAPDTAQSAWTAGSRVLVDVPLRSSGALRKVVPYGAVLYGLRGETWTYVRTEPLTFVRQPITVDFVVGDLAVLTDGPTSGTAVVTVGGAELFGIETGIGK